MEKKPDIKCSDCHKFFAAKCNLRKHVVRYHPEKIHTVAPKKTFVRNYQCEFCERKYSQTKNLNFHKRKVHKDLLNAADRRTILNRKRCPLCDAAISTKDHFSECHGIEIGCVRTEFATFEAFGSWKSAIENSTKTLFVKSCGTYSRHNVETTYYICHRSGHIVRKGKPKSGRTIRIRGYCPANMRLDFKEGKYYLDFVHTHIGHECDLNPEDISKKVEEVVLESPSHIDDLSSRKLPNIKREIEDEELTEQFTEDYNLDKLEVVKKEMKKEQDRNLDDFNVREIVKQEVGIENGRDFEAAKKQFTRQVLRMLDEIDSVEKIKTLKDFLVQFDVKHGSKF